MSSIINETKVLEALRNQKYPCPDFHKIYPSLLMIDSISAKFVGTNFNKIQMPSRHPHKRLPMYVPK
jgi:hypothetical protein